MVRLEVAVMARSALDFSPGAAGPVTGDGPPDWTDLARCREVGPEAFFPEDGQPDWLAKQVCAGCEFWVRAACLATALRGNEWGIWGGTDELERAKLRHATPDQIDAALRRVGKRTCDQCGEDKPFSAYEIRRDNAASYYLRKKCRSCRKGGGQDHQELGAAA